MAKATSDAASSSATGDSTVRMRPTTWSASPGPTDVGPRRPAAGEVEDEDGGDGGARDEGGGHGARRALQPARRVREAGHEEEQQRHHAERAEDAQQVPEEPRR